MSEEKGKREHDYRLHRKYVLVTNFIALLYVVGGASICEYSILGTKITFENANVVPAFLGILFIYSLMRYFQYYVTIAHSRFLMERRLDSGKYFYRLLGKKAWKLSEPEMRKNWSYEIQLIESSTNNITQKSKRFLSDPKPDYFMVLLKVTKSEISGARDLIENSSRQLSKKIELSSFQWRLQKLKFDASHLVKHPNFMESLFPFFLSFLTIVLFAMKQLKVI